MPAVIRFRTIFIVIAGGFATACPANPSSSPDAGADGGVDAGLAGGFDAGPDAGLDGGSDAGLLPGSLCALPGSYVYDSNGKLSVIGTPAAGSPSLSWLKVPPGFCVHYFGNVGNARQIRFAPGGELFVASPSQGTTSGGGNGRAAIIVLADDNHDGYADAPSSTFLSGLPETEGIMFTPGNFYYQNNTQIMRMAYQSGQRVGDPAQSHEVANITIYIAAGHWPKTLDMADDGTIYVGNGGQQDDQCLEPMPFHGGILSINPTPGSNPDGGTPVAAGLRNPISVKCQTGHDNCFALELAEDYSWDTPGSEKLLLIHSGDNWGYPCCANRNRAYVSTQLADGGVTYVTAFEKTDAGIVPIGPPDCSQVTATTNAFEIAETPFGMAFEPGHWPMPWTSRVFVALHGKFGGWYGARVVGIQTDPSTGLPLPSSDLDGGLSSSQSDFATGWDDGLQDHGRPADLAIAPDGRLFLANDTSGDIVWIAPVQ